VVAQGNATANISSASLYMARSHTRHASPCADELRSPSMFTVKGMASELPFRPASCFGYQVRARRRRQASKAAPAKISPGNPAPAIGPGTLAKSVDCSGDDVDVSEKVTDESPSFAVNCGMFCVVDLFCLVPDIPNGAANPVAPKELFDPDAN
jgi:hypothetical protein